MRVHLDEMFGVDAENSPDWDIDRKYRSGDLQVRDTERWYREVGARRGIAVRPATPCAATSRTSSPLSGRLASR